MGQCISIRQNICNEDIQRLHVSGSLQTTKTQGRHQRPSPSPKPGHATQQQHSPKYPTMLTLCVVCHTRQRGGPGSPTPPCALLCPDPRVQSGAITGSLAHRWSWQQDKHQGKHQLPLHCIPSAFSACRLTCLLSGARGQPSHPGGSGRGDPMGDPPPQAFTGWAPHRHPWHPAVTTTAASALSKCMGQGNTALKLQQSCRWR